MKIFSINFGHDASLCVFVDGKLIDFVEIERESRLKHHYGITSLIIRNYLKRNGFSFNDFDMIALSGTQRWAIFHSNDFSVEFGVNSDHFKLLGSSEFPNWSAENFRFFDGYEESLYGKQVELQKLIKVASPLRIKWDQCRIIKDFTGSPIPVGKLAKALRDLDEKSSQRYQSNFIAPYSIVFDEIKKPAFYVDHHFSHANYAAFYTQETALSVTHDGGVNATPFNTGGIYLLDRSKGVLPVMSHGLTLGNIYDAVARPFGLDAGKLMGLASYGRPNRLIDEVVLQYKNALHFGSTMNTKSVVYSILGSASDEFNIREESIKKFKFAFSDLKLAVQAASNVQYFVQNVYVDLISDACEKIKAEINDVENVYMTGGFSLNCPTNSSINHSSNLLKYIPLPGVGDTGLSLGSAFALCSLFGDQPDRQHLNDPMSPAFPPSSIDHTIGVNDLTQLKRVDVENIPTFIAEKLAEGAIFCIHRGRSEVGPRALGHRSIIAWAGIESVRDRINLHKGREEWRPLAPICRAQDFYDYFCGDPEDCRFMLTVSKVKSPAIPAVTHVDNTARVQVVDESDTFLVKILDCLDSLGMAPVIVNTSFNCSGEPLTETFRDAKKSFMQMKFEYLVSEGRIYMPA